MILQDKERDHPFQESLQHVRYIQLARKSKINTEMIPLRSTIACFSAVMIPSEGRARALLKISALWWIALLNFICMLAVDPVVWCRSLKSTEVRRMYIPDINVVFFQEVYALRIGHAMIYLDTCFGVTMLAFGLSIRLCHNISRR